jgi:hypothetical protein
MSLLLRTIKEATGQSIILLIATIFGMSIDSLMSLGKVCGVGSIFNIVYDGEDVSEFIEFNILAESVGLNIKFIRSLKIWRALGDQSTFWNLPEDQRIHISEYVYNSMKKDFGVLVINNGRVGASVFYLYHLWGTFLYHSARAIYDLLEDKENSQLEQEIELLYQHVHQAKEKYPIS